MATAIPMPCMAMASTAGALVLAICARPRAAHGRTLPTTYAHWFRPAPIPTSIHQMKTMHRRRAPSFTSIPPSASPTSLRRTEGVRIRWGRRL
ncbi:hypothetical protein DFH06DRAFT_1177337 [Mycena polygramma]|nr:hypothetical protein DFH06DRAFT_1177337 [Mycena polygramma]